MNSLLTNNLGKGFPANGDELAFIQGVSDHLRLFNLGTIGAGNHILFGFWTSYNSVKNKTTAFSGEVSYQGEMYQVGGGGLIVNGNHAIEEFGIVFNTRTDTRPYENGEALPAYTIREATLVAPGTADAVSLADFTRVIPITMVQKWNRYLRTLSYDFRDPTEMTANIDIKMKSSGDINILGYVFLNFNYTNDQSEEVNVFKLSDNNNKFPSLNIQTSTDVGNTRFPCVMRRLLSAGPGIEENLLTTCQITPEGFLRIRVPGYPYANGVANGTPSKCQIYININFNNQ